MDVLSSVVKWIVVGRYEHDSNIDGSDSNQIQNWKLDMVSNLVSNDLVYGLNRFDFFFPHLEGLEKVLWLKI